MEYRFGEDNQMKKLFAALQTDPSYRRETARYGLADGLLAVFVYLLTMAAYYAIGAYQAATGKYTGIPVNLALTALCILLAVLKKDGIGSLGFRKKHAVPAAVTGLALGLALALFSVITGLAGGNAFSPASKIVSKFFYYLIVIALTEEVVFRGYIQSRLFGLIHNNAGATALAALMFVSMHIPYHMSAAHDTLLSFCAGNWAWFITLFVWHLVFTYLYRRFNSILAPTLFHALMDWSNILFG